MVDGDEMCLWVAESGGRKDLDSVLTMFPTSLTSSIEILMNENDDANSCDGSKMSFQMEKKNSI